MVKVRSHAKRSKRGKSFTVRQHMRTVKPGKARAAARVHQMHPDVSVQKARHIFDMVYGSVKSDIKTEGKVTVSEFGTFKVKKTKARKARPGRNPFTGESIMIKAKPAGKKVKFFPSKQFKESL